MVERKEQRSHAEILWLNGGRLVRSRLVVLRGMALREISYATIHPFFFQPRYRQNDWWNTRRR